VADLRFEPASTSAQLRKRALDVLVSTIAIVALSPVLLLTALLIKLESRGPVYFRQLRMGPEGRPFHIYKFRTFVADSAERQHLFAHLNVHFDPEAPATRIGAVLRRWHLDELPQLFNILKGQMSLVGPAPLIIQEGRRIDERDSRRLSLKPGMLSPWSPRDAPSHTGDERSSAEPA